MIFKDVRIRVPVFTVFCFLALWIIEPSVYSLLLIAAVLVHEAGHITAMAAQGVGIAEIVFLPCGIDIRRKNKFISYKSEILISLCGCGVNLIVFACFCRLRGYGGFFAWVNLIYCAVNLLPITGLDGGEALRSFLKSFFDPRKADKIMKRTSFVFCVLLWICGVYILIVLNGNFSVFAMSVFLFVSSVLKK